MTLKEQTTIRIENQKEKMEEDNQTFGRISVFDRLELKYLESLLKDLEVLELLKVIAKQSTVMTTYDINGIKMIQGTCCMTEQEYNKIKEWLENE